MTDEGAVKSKQKRRAFKDFLAGRVEFDLVHARRFSNHYVHAFIH